MLEDFQDTKDVKLSELAEQVRASSSDVGFATFAALLFRHAAAEDLARYGVGDLMRLARSAWKALQHREPDEPRVVVMAPEEVRITEAESGHAISVVEAVNDDKPFLFGSLKNELHAQDIELHLVVHPVLAVERDRAGTLIAFHGEAHSGDGHQHESFVHVHVDPIDDPDHREALARSLLAVHHDVDAAVADWPKMRALVREAIERYRHMPPPVAPDVLSEAIDFLEAIEKRDFILMGMREYTLDGTPDEGELVAPDEAGLGILRDPAIKVLRRGSELVTMTPEVREFLKHGEPVFIAKANVRSRIHRRVHLDYIGVKRFENGVLAGELRIVGLFTSTAYTQSVMDIPLLRRKVGNVIRRLGFDPESHSGNALVNIMETYPRDELFQIGEDLLARFALAILQLSDRPRVRVLPRIDPFDRFVSILVFVPRDRFSTEVRERIEALMAEAYDGHISARYLTMPEGVLTRLHIIVGRRLGETPQCDPRELEERISAIIRTWADELLRASLAAPKLGLDRFKIASWSESFSESYRATYSAERAVRDITILERITDDTPTAILFFRRDTDGPDRCSLKIYHKDAPILLSARVPILENMGFIVVNERTFRVNTPGTDEGIYIHDMTLAVASCDEIEVSVLAEKLQALFIAVWEGSAESDEYNSLLLNAGLGWREIAVLRALSRYLRQTAIPYGQDLMAETLNRYPAVARALVAMFTARFDPTFGEADREAAVARLDGEIEELCNEIISLADDTIVHRFKNLIEATVRTNLYQHEADGSPVATFAFKFDPHALAGLPRPAPFREIWVYSPRVEGVHLRFGAVARGGLRWSDRPQDFRTEVLGLVKAQQVKNAVIVPVGAKGGFFPKKLPDRAQRDAFFEEGREAYKIFIDTLLDITDDIGPDGIEPPAEVIRYEGDDPYLVVAADKGTATFSDTANAIAAEHGFWLDDAFASGGSAGYDHKAMGITARGAWEAVKRHFREMNHDIQSEPFAVVGVGDMSGDVFGNGMLLSRKTKLVAAFDHRDIFIDPNPDPEASYAARLTLFNMPRSSWQDYDRATLSAGGGIYSRSAKSIDLSPEARVALDMPSGPLTPTDVMRAILKAPVDLLWFGGIGTYVRAASESNLDIGDRANDAIRIEAREVRAKVVGEGANLGVSQKARIAYALKGGRINSDAIDNSAGVNTSDVEVNIKIALAGAMRSGRLERADRDALLVEMTDEVAELVLRNNYLQTLAISLSRRQSAEAAGFQRRLMEALEPSGLDRELEDLPSNQTLTDRVAAGEGLSRPEIGVLLAYAKIVLFDQILQSDVPDDAYLGRELDRYFPSAMRERFAEDIHGHRLRREIIATQLANSMINRGGPTFIIRVGDQTGAPVEDIARAYAAARDCFSLTEINAEVDALDNKIDGDMQLELYQTIRGLLTDATVWFVRNETFSEGLATVVDRFRGGIGELRDTFAEMLPPDDAAHLRAQAAGLMELGVPEALAPLFARMPLSTAALDIVVVASACEVSLREAGEVWFALNDNFKLASLDLTARTIPVDDYYDGLAVDRARRTLADAHRGLAVEVLASMPPGPGAERVAAWMEAQGAAVTRTRRAVADIIDGGRISISRISVAAGLLADLSGDDVVH
ncbi:NAD-glutamate dehydrogenase [Acuticoccus mangrovi]|uniref:NAD-glutamate dehydrogenase n=1 Tax=Acuticoccus mangrovi TaxID=2796142 RepID=A0A934IT68_9HYPH|nr:NAD-glutamate dehydrogenase [Acuticoccus mangrovi]MBJ3777570.1 NAD-glutamate dehydrogenase [Acuticoccus mangrovi]